MHDMGSLGRTLQIDLPGRVEGGGQPVLSFEQFLFHFPLLLAFRGVQK